MYQEQIKKLDWVIENWDLIFNKPKKARRLFEEFCNDPLIVDTGLCFNCDLCFLNKNIRNLMFSSFHNFSGDFDYPLGEEEFSLFMNFAETTERLELAKHCLKFLMEKQNES